ncbi:DUF4184 family protein [Hymenobacter sp. B1770]|uniref:DUF4184 family protein n=1 Tax=Hymenobacter sp. B1770 TaxID=1718788 RepID=UPI003CF2A38C
MPFTFAHPALVLPFLNAKRTWFSATGLIAGSIVPDFEYFLRMRKGLSYYSHTWPGLFWFDLPFAVLLTLVFHAVVRTPLLQRLPAPIYSRLAPCALPNWPRTLRHRWLTILLSILLGTLTHFGWDWFVHQSSDYLFEHQRRLFALHELVSHSQVYAAVHLGHTLLGLAAIAWAIFRLPALLAPTQNQGFSLKFWSLIALFTACMSSLRIKLGTDMYSQDWLVAVLSAFLLALTLACLWLTLAKTSRSSSFDGS